MTDHKSRITSVTPSYKLLEDLGITNDKNNLTLLQLSLGPSIVFWVIYALPWPVPQHSEEFLWYSFNKWGLRDTEEKIHALGEEPNLSDSQMIFLNHSDTEMHDINAIQLSFWYVSLTHPCSWLTLQKKERGESFAKGHAATEGGEPWLGNLASFFRPVAKMGCLKRPPQSYHLSTLLVERVDGQCQAVS